MINASYFNGDRERLFARLLNNAKNVLEHVKVGDALIMNSEVMLDAVKLVGVEKIFGRDYLLPFCVEAKCITSKKSAMVAYEYPGNFSREKEEDGLRTRVELKVDVVKDVVRYVKFGEIPNYECGIFPSLGFFPPTYKRSEDSGQLKITVDLVLAVEDMILKEKKDIYKILVIGSSSPGGVRAGMAYMVIPYMCDAKIDLWDPHEVTRKFSIEGDYKVDYQFYSFKFPYNKKKPKVYDLILDDSWEKGITRNDRDPKDFVTTAKNFSIKQFPWERSDRKGNVYHQMFYTKGLEERRVSRDPRIVSDVDHVKLGRCEGCRELSLRLRNLYSDNFYRAFMNVHTKNCLTGKRYIEDLVESYNGWIEIVPFPINYDMYCSLNYDYFDGTKMVGISMEGIEGCRYLFSSKSNIPSKIIREGLQVLVFEQSSGKYFVNKVLGEDVLGKELIEKVDGKINLSHSKTKRDPTFNKRHGKQRYAVSAVKSNFNNNSEKDKNVKLVKNDQLDELFKKSKFSQNRVRKRN